MLQFEIFARAIPQKKKLGKGFLYTPSDVKNYMQMLQWQVKPFAPRQPLECPISVDITCYFTPPKSTSGIRRRQMLNQVIHHTVYPDLDNCTYIIKNALKNIVFKDDRQIVDEHGHKRWGERDKIVIRVVPYEEIARIRGDECA